MKKLLLLSMLVLLVTLSFNVFAAGPGPIQPDLYLTVTQSPLDVYPPIMIFTAKLNWPLPITTSTQIMVDFYNGLVGGPPMFLIGSAQMDLRTGIATISKQMPAGSYQAIAKTVVNGQSLTSNMVYYKVP